MKKLIWPEQVYPLLYACSVCKAVVDNETNSDGVNKWFTPVSRYWNPSKNEVYCSAEHSLLSNSR
jgi:hypothetical protein